jgi:hypothetical protein
MSGWLPAAAQDAVQRQAPRRKASVRFIDPVAATV